ncbi:MAG TPA: hypothetical protein VEJ19_07880 [Nitrososphaerales archaeon]|nr:hypothetical protein [Nitrososphaerales archaeon]
MDRGVALFAGVAIFAILVVGAAVAFVPLVPTTTQAGSSTTSTSTSTTSSTITTASNSSKDSLALRLTLNASVVFQGYSLSLSVGEWNNLNAQNDVGASQTWPIEGLGVGPCGSGNYPFGFEVLSGYYNSSAGLDSAQKIQLYGPVPYSCPMILSGISSYSFYPLSDRADVYGSCGSNPCFTEDMNTTAVVGGNWSGGSLVPLPPGAYTVVAGDEWGALLFGHFEVVATEPGGMVILPQGTVVQVSSSYDCVAGHYTLPFNTQDEALLTGGFSAEAPGVTLYVATAQQASVVFQGHPSSWMYSTGLENSSRFATNIPAGAYVVWIEGADLNCGAHIVMPLEMLTTLNITEAFMINSTGS